MQLMTTSDDERAPARKECASPPRWHHFPVRTIEDVQRVCSVTGIPADLAGDALDLDELARIDHHPSGAILVVLRAPVRHEPQGHVRTTALSVVIGRDSVVTMAAPELDIEPRDGAGSPLRVLARLLLIVADRFIVELRAIDAAVNVLETELQASLRNSELRGLLMHQKSLVHFRTAIASNMILLDRLGHDARFRADDTEAELLDDAIVEMRQAAEMTRVSSDILGEMMDAFASIISNNLNVVMKVMAALTIVIAVPSLVAALYGMNVALPGQHSSSAFVVIATASGFVAAALVLLFRKIRWL
jgi:magnesium transporter